MGTQESVGLRPSFQHILLTRFNVRFVDDPNAPSIGVDPTWLEDRFQLFERYCLPSILAQKSSNFIWLIFFDTATPEPFLSRAKALAELDRRIIPYFAATLPINVVTNTIRQFLPEPAPQWILTSRVDNDDGIAPDFVSAIQEAQSLKTSEVLNCPLGLIACEGRAYLRRDDSNAFISLSEPYQNFRTVLSILRHRNAHAEYPVKQLAETPLWLQIVHKRNVSNRIRGWRVEASAISKYFPYLPPQSAASAEHPIGIFAENLTASAFRSSRDAAISVARRIAMLFGIELRRKVAPAAKMAAQRQAD
jgi:Putative rhamnosyl transferase